MLVLACAVSGLSACATARRASPALEPLDLQRAVSAASGNRGPDGPLAACKANLDRYYSKQRAEFFRQLTAFADDPRNLVVVLEWTDVSNVRYGYAAAVEDRVVRRFFRDPTDEPASPGWRPVLERLRADPGALQGDESLGDQVSGGSCYFLGVRRGGEWSQAGLFMPQLLGPAVAELERAVLAALAPYGEDAPLTLPLQQ